VLLQQRLSPSSTASQLLLLLQTLQGTHCLPSCSPSAAQTTLQHQHHLQLLTQVRQAVQLLLQVHQAIQLPLHVCLRTQPMQQAHPLLVSGAQGQTSVVVGQLQSSNLWQGGFSGGSRHWQPLLLLGLLLVLLTHNTSLIPPQHLQHKASLTPLLQLQLQHQQQWHQQQPRQQRCQQQQPRQQRCQQQLWLLPQLPHLQAGSSSSSSALSQSHLQGVQQQQQQQQQRQQQQATVMC
jgi:hypothetical protein